MYFDAKQAHALRHHLAVIISAREILTDERPELADNPWLAMIGRNARDLLMLVTELETPQ